MRNKKTVENIFYIILFISWILPGFRNRINFETAILISVFLLSCAIIFFIKDNKYKYVILLPVTVATSVYSYEYILLYVPILLLIIMCYILSGKENEKKTLEICNMACTVSVILKIVYIVLLFVKVERRDSGIWNFYAKVAGIIFVFFVLLLITSYKKGNKIDKKKLPHLKSLYLFSATGVIADFVIFMLKNSYGKVQAAQFDFLAWFVLVLIVMYFKDPATEILFNTFNRKIELFLNLKTQSK